MEELIRNDGYINITKLCQKTNKKPGHWLRLKQTKDLIKVCSKYTGIDESKLLEVCKGNSVKYNQGTWGHPLLATNVAQWISNEFAIKVCLWIEEWKQINNNKKIYNNEINNLKPDFVSQKEKEIQLKLQKELGGEIEIFTDSGYIDLLTENEIIEIKDGKRWKDAVGQILIYSLDYPKHTKRIHLFDIEYDINVINKCKVYNIVVSYEN